MCVNDIDLLNYILNMLKSTLLNVWTNCMFVGCIIQLVNLSQFTENERFFGREIARKLRGRSCKTWHDAV